MSKQVLLSISNNEGYAPDQIHTKMTLGELFQQVQEAIDMFGEDALIVTAETGNQRGARFGSLSSAYGDLFTDADPDGDDDEADELRTH